MASHFRVVNLSNGFRLKPAHALRAIEQCSAEWVEQGVSIRNLSLAESICKRNEMAKNSEPLPYSEVAGITFKGPLPNDFNLIRQAHEFCANAI